MCCANAIASAHPQRLARIHLQQQHQRLLHQPALRWLRAERQRQLGVRQRDPNARAGASDHLSAIVTHQGRYAADGEYSEYNRVREQSVPAGAILLVCRHGLYRCCRRGVEMRGQGNSWSEVERGL